MALVSIHFDSVFDNFRGNFPCILFPTSIPNRFDTKMRESTRIVMPEASRQMNEFIYLSQMTENPTYFNINCNPNKAWFMQKEMMMVKDEERLLFFLMTRKDKFTKMTQHRKRLAISETKRVIREYPFVEWLMEDISDFCEDDTNYEELFSDIPNTIKIHILNENFV